MGKGEEGKEECKLQQMKMGKGVTRQGPNQSAKNKKEEMVVVKGKKNVWEGGGGVHGGWRQVVAGSRMVRGSGEGGGRW